jgi:hypothetical protein
MTLIASEYTAAVATTDGSLNLASDPQAVRALAQDLAAAIAQFSPDVVVHWNSTDHAVLAHVVAELLGVGRAEITEDLGLLTLDPDVRGLTRAVLVGTSFRFVLRTGSVRTMLEQSGVDLVAVVEHTPGGGFHFAADEASR